MSDNERSAFPTVEPPTGPTLAEIEEELEWEGRQHEKAVKYNAEQAFQRIAAGYPQTPSGSVIVPPAELDGLIHVDENGEGYVYVTLRPLSSVSPERYYATREEVEGIARGIAADVVADALQELVSVLLKGLAQVLIEDGKLVQVMAASHSHPEPPNGG